MCCAAQLTLLATAKQERGPDPRLPCVPLQLTPQENFTSSIFFKDARPWLRFIGDASRTPDDFLRTALVQTGEEGTLFC